MRDNRILEILQDLVRIPSQYGQEHEISSWVFDLLTHLGYEANKVDVPESGPDVIAEFVVDPDQPWILLNSHTDTVEEMAGWSRDPYGERDGDQLYGIGACDMKSGLAVQLAIMEGLQRGDIKPHLNVLFTAVSDEELWSRGTITLIEKNIITPEIAYAIVGEPHSLGNITVGRRGRLIFDIIVYGKAAHAAFPEKGVNAITEAVHVIQSLESLDVGYMEEFNITGSKCLLAINGKAISLSVPEKVLLVLDRHYLPAETPERVSAGVTEVIKRTKLHPTTKVEVRPHPRPTPPPKPFYTPLDNPLVRIAGEQVKLVTHTEPQFLLERTAADSNFIGMLGIPTIDLGPSGRKPHQADEYADVQTLEPVYQIYQGILSSLS